MTYLQKVSKTFLSDIWLGRCVSPVNLRENSRQAQYFMGIIGSIFCF